MKKLLLCLLILTGCQFKPDTKTIPASPHNEWTFHEVHPLNSKPWVEWINEPRNLDVKFRPKVPPKLKEYMDKHPRDTSKPDSLFGPDAIVWRDMTVDGGYTWYEGKMKSFRGTNKDNPRPQLNSQGE